MLREVNAIELNGISRHREQVRQNSCNFFPTNIVFKIISGLLNFEEKNCLNLDLLVLCLCVLLSSVTSYCFQV